MRIFLDFKIEILNTNVYLLNKEPSFCFKYDDDSILHVYNQNKQMCNNTTLIH